MMKFKSATFLTLLSSFGASNAFVSPARTFGTNAFGIASQPPSFSLFAATSTDAENEVGAMRAGEIKKELESYGISTKSFLEKSELVDALVKARADGLKPKQSAASSASSPSSTDTSSSTKSSSSTSSREDRLKVEMENCNAMRAGELKKELEERGISTKSFFEKSEFVKALAEARVDNIQRATPGGGSSGGVDEEGYAEYANVEVLTDDSSGPRQKSSEQSQQQQSGGNPFGGGGMPGGMGGNPFGGGGMPGGMGGNPFGGSAGGGMPGGMGGMGDIADMLKNMGMGGGGGGGAGNPFGGAGGGGGNPFGGAAGGNPFGGMGGMGGMGDAMGKAQQMMKNPKVMELMSKAQSNPKIMAAMTECMSNPAAFAKYQNDPEVSEIINELRKYM